MTVLKIGFVPGPIPNPTPPTEGTILFHSVSRIPARFRPSPITDSPTTLNG